MTRGCAAIGAALLLAGCQWLPLERPGSGAEPAAAEGAEGDAVPRTAAARGTPGNGSRPAGTPPQLGASGSIPEADAAERTLDDSALAGTVLTQPADATGPEAGSVEPAVDGAAARPTELIERLRRQFSLPPADDAAVETELAWFVRHPEYLDRVFTRSGRYLFHIAGELERRGMPGDLALLPIVESAYDPFAYSHGRAAGLWQIIPGTGRHLGLKQNWWYDGRRDVVDSTRAALDYFEQLHGEFDDWLLAVAGYNSGAGNVRRAQRRAAAAGLPGDFWHIRRYLPRETRTYVPRLLALTELVADPAAHGVTLPAIDNAPYFAIVDTGGQIDLALAAELAGLDTDTLYTLNPGFNRWATDPDGPHRLLVPVTHVEPFATGLTRLGERERVRWTRHRVEPGETLGGLAMRYRTTTALLRNVNELRGNLIRAGDYLMIPHALQSLEAYTQTQDARTARQQNRQRDGQRRAHVVNPGDSLWTISRHYGVGVRELASWNAMAPGDVLSVGRELVIWSDQPLTASASPQQGERIRRIDYVVRRGDSLYSIATRFRVTVANLVQWNDIQPSRYLQPGQRLVMYVDVTQQSS